MTLATPSTQRASAVRRARIWLPLLLLLTVGVSAWAGSVTVSVQEKHGTYTVLAELWSPVPPRIAWIVLTDYDHIDGFVRSMRASRSVRQSDGRLIVQQDASVGVFPVRRVIRVALDIREDTGQRITFEDQLGKDFHSYSGEWRITAERNGTRITYRLEATPRRTAPFAGRSLVSHDVRNLLTQVGVEMERRAAVASATGAILESRSSLAPPDR